MCDPRIHYHGLDSNARRVAMANRTAAHLGLENARFEVGDARGELPLDDEYDAVLMMDLMHHLPLDQKRHVLDTVTPRLAPDGSLIIKEITRRPRLKLFFTWALDVLMTRGFDMWYWNPHQFREAVDDSFRMEVYPIADLLPYPHVVYLFSREAGSGE